MKMQPSRPSSLWHALIAAGDSPESFVCSADTRVSMSALVSGSILDGRGDELYGRTVVIVTSDQLTAALSLLELDGIAKRVVLYPYDLTLNHLPFVIETAKVDAIVTDRTEFGPCMPRVQYFMPCARKIVPQSYDRTAQQETEWVLLTSGTVGPPKLVVHTLSSLIGAIEPRATSTGPIVWSTFYDIRRYGGLQIFLRTALTGASLVLSSLVESSGAFLARAGSCGVTHISGTPSQWRRAMMSSCVHLINPRYVRVSGEIADQGVLNQLRSVYPQAKIAHAFASTEAGVAFEVNDGNAGFPADAIDHTPNVEMKVESGTLRIRSQRTADRYLGENVPVLKCEDGFVDTEDVVELEGGRYYFVGRRDGLINVGGLKVHPEEVEAVLNRHPEVHMSLVRKKKSPVTGSVVVADVVLRAATQFECRGAREVRDGILLYCRESLASYKVPALINIVPNLAVAESGKMMREHA
jgi:acyl-coenzyme A synthetase/AMP-(fatty) acid ligase